MISEAIKRIEDLSCQALETEVIQLPGDNPDVVYVRQPDGTLKQFDLEPNYRTIKLDSLTDLLKMARDHFDQGVRERGRTLLIFNCTFVTLIFDHKNSRESAIFAFNCHPEFDFFNDLNKAPLISPADLRSAMRTTIAGCMVDSKLADLVGKINFVSTDSTKISLERGKSNFGRSIDEQVDVAVPLPNPKQIFNVRMWSDQEMDQRFPLECLMDPDPASKQWFIKPVCDSWMNLKDQHMRALRGMIEDAVKETNIPVYNGRFEQR